MLHNVRVHENKKQKGKRLRSSLQGPSGPCCYCESLLCQKLQYGPFLHSVSVRSDNSTKARLRWTFSYMCYIFVHHGLDSAPLFVEMRENLSKQPED